MAGLLGWLPEIADEYRLGKTLGGLDLNGNPDELDQRAKMLLGSGNPEQIGIALKLMETSRRARDQQSSLQRQNAFSEALKSFTGGGGEPATPAGPMAPGPQSAAPVEMDEMSGQARRASVSAPSAPAPRNPQAEIARLNQLLLAAPDANSRAIVQNLISQRQKLVDESMAESRIIRAEDRASKREAEKNQRELFEQIDKEQRVQDTAIKTEERKATLAVETDAQKEQSGHFYKYQNKIFDDAAKAAEQKQSLQIASDIVEDPLFTSGYGSGVTGYVGYRAAPIYRMGRALGIDPDNSIMKGLKNAKDARTLQESFNSIADKLVLDRTGGSLGNQISNTDRDFIRGVGPNINDTPDGNKAKIRVLQKFVQRQEEIAELARQYPGRSRSELDGIIKAHADTHPLFSSDERNFIMSVVNKTDKPVASPIKDMLKTKSGISWSLE